VPLPRRTLQRLHRKRDRADQPGRGGCLAQRHPRAHLAARPSRRGARELGRGYRSGDVWPMCGGAGLVLGRGRAYGAKPCLTQTVDELRCAARPNRLRHGRFAERDGCRTAHGSVPYGRPWAATWTQGRPVGLSRCSGSNSERVTPSGKPSDKNGTCVMVLPHRADHHPTDIHFPPEAHCFQQSGMPKEHTAALKGRRPSGP
jgi:hypothetical protein